MSCGISSNFRHPAVNCLANFFLAFVNELSCGISSGPSAFFGELYCVIPSLHFAGKLSCGISSGLLAFAGELSCELIWCFFGNCLVHFADELPYDISSSPLAVYR
ncbi:hypothetical protein F8M41_016924 [Gigaspora margarita]|uniref:Uncharacterized protein n=1 Tax=Gigaspora margarita TaxID=4874 RepID=A0A8H4EMF7_GIGMA|nr:hypothetical protein F8M41_016924 [Gigaspora margarita]